MKSIFTSAILIGITKGVPLLALWASFEFNSYTELFSKLTINFAFAMMIAQLMVGSACAKIYSGAIKREMEIGSELLFPYIIGFVLIFLANVDFYSVVLLYAISIIRIVFGSYYRVNLSKPALVFVEGSVLIHVYCLHAFLGVGALMYFSGILSLIIFIALLRCFIAAREFAGFDFIKITMASSFVIFVSNFDLLISANQSSEYIRELTVAKILIATPLLILQIIMVNGISEVRFLSNNLINLMVNVKSKLVKVLSISLFVFCVAYYFLRNVGWVGLYIEFYVLFIGLVGGMAAAFVSILNDILLIKKSQSHLFVNSIVYLLAYAACEFFEVKLNLFQFYLLFLICNALIGLVYMFRLRGGGCLCAIIKIEHLDSKKT